MKLKRRENETEKRERGKKNQQVFSFLFNSAKNLPFKKSVHLGTEK